MWSRIAKVVDDVMEAELPRSIESHRVEHIINAILDCALPLEQLVAKENAPKFGNKERKDHYSHGPQASRVDQLSNKLATWAEKATLKRQIGIPNNLTLVQSLKGV